MKKRAIVRYMLPYLLACLAGIRYDNCDNALF
jgi:hypothetical protein